MRLIQRRALIVAVAVALVSSLAVLPSVASAAKSKSTPIQKLSKRVTTISRKLNTVANNLKSVTGTVNQGIPIITQLVSGLQAASSGLTQLKDGLNTLSAAVQNTTTGLPGLNAARSLVGAVVSSAAATGSEFTVTHAGPGTYVLSFVNGATPPVATDVSKRSVVITPFPSLGHVVTAAAVNCSVATNPCTTADTKATDELVTTQADGSAAPVDENFQVAAISG